jgi:hypothetical protein
MIYLPAWSCLTAERIMPAFMYRCPNTGNLVQGFVALEMSGGASSIVAVTCLIC